MRRILMSSLRVAVALTTPSQRHDDAPACAPTTPGSSLVVDNWGSDVRLPPGTPTGALRAFLLAQGDARLASRSFVETIYGDSAQVELDEGRTVPLRANLRRYGQGWGISWLDICGS
jgi:hypothetical protein